VGRLSRFFSGGFLSRIGAGAHAAEGEDAAHRFSFIYAVSAMLSRCLRIEKVANLSPCATVVASDPWLDSAMRDVGCR
jgi:hypothetical protein